MDYVYLQNDLLFHMVFTRSQNALKGLLSSLLGIPVTAIYSIDVLNPVQLSDQIESKTTILDLRVNLNNEKFVIVEMQVREFGAWTNRQLVYGCRQVTDQAVEGFNYVELQPVISIAIMGYTLFEDNKRFFTRYTIQDENGYPFTDKLQFIVMDLTAVNQATDEEKKQGLVEWADAFRAQSWDELGKIKNSGVKEAAKMMQAIIANPADRELIRVREKAMMDFRAFQMDAMKKGRDEGRDEGLEEGERIANIKTARNLKALGMAPSVIMSAIPALTIADMEAL